jgi:hypothetical protein
MARGQDARTTIILRLCLIQESYTAAYLAQDHYKFSLYPNPSLPVHKPNGETIQR